VKVLEDLLNSVKVEGEVRSLAACSLITASVVEISGRLSCGVATTVVSGLHESSRPAVRDAGYLEGRPASELVALLRSSSPTEVSIAMATLNALLQYQNMTDSSWQGNPQSDVNASTWISEIGSDKKVALVGHFPFVQAIREAVRELWVLEKTPHDGKDLPAEKAEELIPQADLLALTSMTLVNKTFENLVELARPGIPIIVVGPGTPLSPVLFEHGVTTLAGAVVEDIDRLVGAARQGANFRQARKQGLRFLVISRKK
jgi:uncharacterized protein (DUF4213/DUF364 family)